MGEEKHEVKTYEIDMRCDICGEGYMRQIGNIVLTTYPILYPHECTVCGHKENYNKKYPYIVYEEEHRDRKNKYYVPE